MATIKKITDKQGNDIYLRTHTKAVVDDNGYTAESRLQAMQDEINQAQLEVDAVPSDLTPTENSSNWVTSGGIYNTVSPLDEALNGKKIYSGYTSGKYVDVNSGSIKSDANWALTEYIPVQPASRISVFFMKSGDIAHSCASFYDSDYNYITSWTSTGYTNVRTFTANDNGESYLRCGLSLSNIEKCKVYVNDVLVWDASGRLGSIISELDDVKTANSVKYSPLDVYENGEVSTDSNSYDKFPSGSNMKRARIKKEFIQEIPDGAVSVSYSIGEDAFVNGTYKIGWSQYTSDYMQISSTVQGWFTSATTQVQIINANAKYFMFYIAPVSNSDTVDVSTLQLDSFTVKFDNSIKDYGKEISCRHLSFVYPLISSELKSINDLISVANSNYNIFSINHRGYSTVAPENTIPAFILSKKKGFQYVEADVLFTSDEVPVILHDTTINRTARNIDGTSISSTIAINSITYEQALEYDYGIFMGSNYAGTKIPTFEEFIVACKKLVLHPFIELKDVMNGTSWTDARIEKIANVINKYGMAKNVSFISFSPSALQKVSVYFPYSRLGLGYEGTYSSSGLATVIANAQSLKLPTNEVMLTLKYTSMTNSLYEQVVDAGISPIVWTVNSESAVLSLSDYVVGVLSDNQDAGKLILANMLKS